MTSPFPGMDPYLEGYLWPDVHNRLANVVAELLAPQISPKYVARIELYTVSDTLPQEEIGIMYPDVEVLKNNTKTQEPPLSYPSHHDKLSPITISLPEIQAIEVRIPVVEIKDRGNNQLITAIEILSPVNKRTPGLIPYRQKRQTLHSIGVHILEIDLLRRGTRPFNHPLLPDQHYIVSLLRAEGAETDIWGFDVQDLLPVVPVPLLADDPDAMLDLGEAMNIIYKRSLYHLSIDYSNLPPNPPFTEKELDWMRKEISKQS